MSLQDILIWDLPGEEIVKILFTSISFVTSAMTSLDPGYEELAFSHPGIYFFRPRWPHIEFCMSRTQHPPLACGLYLCNETLKMRDMLYFVLTLLHVTCH